MPIFEKIRAQDQVPCAFPIHMGAGGTVFVRCNTSRSVPLSPHVLHCHPTTHWVSAKYRKKQEEREREETKKKELCEGGSAASLIDRVCGVSQRELIILIPSTLSLSLNRYASVLCALYPCRVHHALRCQPAHPTRSAITRAVMVDPRVVIHRARSPIQAHAPV